MTEVKRPLKVFLCHASADKPKVRELYRTLKRRGIQPWLDAEDLIPGQNWEVEIPKALLSSDAIIICLTPNSVDKEGYVQKEIKFALDKAMEIPEGRIFLIPARLEECDLPSSLSKYQAVNLYEKVGYTKLMQALKLRAAQLERATVALPKSPESIETSAEIKNAIEEKKPPLLKEEKPEIETPKPSAEKVDVVGGPRDSAIVPSSGNVFYFDNQEVPAPEKLKSEKPQPQKTRSPRKPNTAIIVALIGLVGIIVAALLASPIIEKWFSAAPSATELATATIDLVSQSVVSAETIELSQTPAESFTLTPTPLPTEITDAKGVSMVLVPAGEFIMGLGVSYRGDETPANSVYLDTFYIDKYEVTNAAYKLCVSEMVCLPIYNESDPYVTAKTLDYYENSKFSNYPVVDVSWDMAKAYCEWRDSNLPTEAQWEKAARGTDGRFYPWGNDVPSCEYANHYSQAGSRCVDGTAQVGSYIINQSIYGAYDMAGNVWEWVADWYDKTYYQEMDLVNPLGPLVGNYRVIRGGGWEFSTTEKSVTSYNRDYLAPQFGREDVGFRCARSIELNTDLTSNTLIPSPITSPIYEPSLTVTPTQNVALVRIYNRFNVKKDIYVDGQLIVEALEPGQYIQVSLFLGIHDFYTCPVETLRCDSGYDYSVLIDVKTNPFSVELGR